MFDVLTDLLAGTASGSVEGFLVGVAARAFLALLLATCIAFAMRRASAARRHLAWTLAIVIVLALPLGSLLLPRIQIEVPGLGAPASGAAHGEMVGVAGDVSRRVGARSGGWAGSQDGVAPRSEGRAKAANDPNPTHVSERASAAGRGTGGRGTPPSNPMGAGVAATDGASAVVSGPRRSIDPSKALLVIWLVGVVLGLARLAISSGRVRWLENRAETISTGPLYDRMRTLAHQVGVSRPPVLLRGDATTIPMTWGVRQPRIVLPAGAESWAAWRIEAVLVHELGHIARRDYLAQLAATIMCSLHWFDPLAWLAARRMQVEREHACDDLVISWGHEPSSYARDLLELAKALRPTPMAASAAVCFARPNRLRDRLVALMDDKRDRQPIVRGTVTRATLTAVLLAIPVAAMAPVPEAVADATGAVAGATEAVAGATEDLRVPAVPAVELSGLSNELGSGQDLVERVTPTVQSLTDGDLDSVDRPPLRTPAMGQTSFRTHDVNAQQATTLCGPANGDAHSRRSNTSDDVITIEMEYGECRSSARIEGDIAFNEDFTSVTRLPSRSFLRLEVSRNGEQRRIEVRPSSGGVPQFQWSVDGRERPFDSVAQQWLAGALLDLFRSSSFKATERATWILSQEGVEGVFAEVAMMWAGHAQARYLEVLLEQGDLDQVEIRRLFEIAGREIDSDHSLGTVLATAAEEYAFDPTTLGAFIDAAATLESDHQHGIVLGIALGRGDLSQENLEALLESATSGLESDHRMAEILVALAARYPLDPGLRGPFLRAAETLESDHQKGRVYGIVLDQPGLGSAELAAVLDAASTMGSDHTLSELLMGAAAHDLSDPALKGAFLRAAGSIESDHNRSRVLDHALRLPGLTDEDLADILSSSSTVQSDHLLANLLEEVADRGPTGRATRQAFLSTLGSIGGDHDLARALGAFVGLDLSETELTEALDAATRGLDGDHQMAEFLLLVADRHALEGSVRDAFSRALATVESRHQRDRVQSRLTDGRG